MNVGELRRRESERAKEMFEESRWRGSAVDKYR
jgi:hypothetical protein